MTNDPGNIMIAQTQEESARKFAADEIGKVFRHCSPVMERMIGEKTIFKKGFYGGSLSVVWSTAENSFRGPTIRYLFLDEVSNWADDVEGAGCPIDMAIVRTETISQRKIVIGSTPKHTGTCKITREFLLTDQRYYYVPCPHCQHMQRLKFENFRSKDPKAAHFACIHCPGKIKERHKFDMVEAGQWRATRKFTCCDKEQEPKHWDETGTALCIECDKAGDTNVRGKVESGFHIWTAYNDNPNTSLPSIAKSYNTVRKDSTRLQSFMNQTVGVEFSSVSKLHKIENFEELHKRREEYTPLNKLPEGTICVLGSVDTQGDRFEYHRWAVGAMGEIWAIDYGKIVGDPEEEKTRIKLIEKLKEPLTLHDGREIEMYAAVIDCQGNKWWSDLLELCNEHPNFLYGIRGQATKKDKFSHDLTISIGKESGTGFRFHNINVHQLKNRAAERLNNLKPGKNYIHFPENDNFSLDYFHMLTAEELIGDGGAIKWEKKKGQVRNEPWDLLVYCLWLYDFLSIKNETKPLGLTENTVTEEYQNYSDGYDVSNYEHY